MVRKSYVMTYVGFLICLYMKLSVTRVSGGNTLKIAVFCNVLPCIGDNLTETLAVGIVRDIKTLQSVDILSRKTVIFITAVRASAAICMSYIFENKIKTSL